MTQRDQNALVERIASRIDGAVIDQMAMTSTAPAFQSMRDVMEFAKVMAVAGVGIRNHLRSNPGACAAVCLQAARWGLDPFMVANKSYAVNDQIAYESQLIAAVVNTRAPIKGRLKTRFVGEGAARKCIVSGTFVGEDEPTEVESPAIGTITPKNSPLWKSDPDQQLAYYTKRLWARREVPEILLGVYDVEELSQHVGPENAKDITPPRPIRADFVKSPAEKEFEEAVESGAVRDAIVEVINEETGEVTTVDADTPQRDAAFWNADSFEVRPPTKGKNGTDWKAWRALFDQRLGEASVPGEVARLDHDNAKWIGNYTLADNEAGADLRAAIAARAGELQEVE